jgi:hypothetical protein
MKEIKKKAYLYSRVSKAKQAADGKGLQRQKEMALDFLSQHPEYEIADVFEDAGVSAFYAKNLKKDAGLGGFLQVCKEGKIQPDSCLIVEAVDRLSRLGIDEGMLLFAKLKKYKINVAITKFNLIIYWDDKNNLTNSIQVASGLYLGHLESEQKSKRILKTFKLQMDETRKGERLFRSHSRPNWLEVSEDGKSFICPEENAALIRRIFRLRLHDRQGIRQIIHYLNSQGIKTFSGNEWAYTSTNKILRNEALIGTYQPKNITYNEEGVRVDRPNGDPILNYYPRVIEEDVFAAVQEAFGKSPHSEKSQGKKSGYKNIFRYMVYCRRCGAPYITKTIYLKCNNNQRACNGRYINYQKIEDKLLNFFKSTSFLSHFEKVQEIPSKIGQYREELEKLISAEQGLHKALEVFTNDDMLHKTVKRIEDIHLQKVELNKLIEEEALRESTNLYNEIQTEDDLSDVFNREKYNSILRSSLDYIQFLDKFIFIRISGFDYDLVLNEELPNLFLKRSYSADKQKETIMFNPDVLRDMNIPEKEIKKIRSNTPNSDDEFFEKQKFTIDTHRAIEIFEQQIDENKTRKQTTRKLTSQKLCLTDEDLEQIKININHEQRMQNNSIDGT